MPAVQAVTMLPESCQCRVQFWYSQLQSRSIVSAFNILGKKFFNFIMTSLRSKVALNEPHELKVGNICKIYACLFMRVLSGFSIFCSKSIPEGVCAESIEIL